MKTLHLLLVMFTVIILASFGLQQIHADNVNGVYVKNIQIQPSTVKVGDSFTVTATLVNNSTFPTILDSGKCSITDTLVPPFFTVMFDNHAKIKTKNISCAGVGWSQILNPGKSITGTSPDYTATYIATESGIANATVTFSYHVINQTDPTQPGFSQTISKSFLFTILDNNTETKTITKTVLSPLKQFKSGIQPVSVTCNNAFVLIIKTEDQSPACVRPQTAIQLDKTGWGTRISSNSNKIQTSLHDMSDSSSSLRLYLSVTPAVIQSGESVGIKISVNNPLLHAINVTAQDNWSYENVSTGPCSTIGYGIAILEGYYTTENMTRGKNMPLYGANVLCPMMAKTAQVYQFQPQSDQVKEIVCKKITGFSCYSGMEEMGQNYGFDGYWDWKSDKGKFFKPDKYTVIGADEWRHVAIEHFVVTNSTRDRK